MTVAGDQSVGLAALWRLLSLGFGVPREETMREVEAIAEALVEVSPSSSVEDVLSAVRYSSIDAVASQYLRLFGGSVLVSPYEGGYEHDPIRQGRQMADVAAFYRAFGAEAQGPAAERPDHIGCELEFLAFLELRRLAALEEDDDEAAHLVDGIAEKFLRDHAGRWMPTFFANVHQAAESAPLYRALAALGLRTVASELERRSIECPPLARRHDRLSVERDSFECGWVRSAEA